MAIKLTKIERATRINLQFNVPGVGGTAGVTDLWQLPLPTLDTIARALHTELESSKDVSFIEDKTPTKARRLTQLRFDIVKRIIDVKLEAKQKAEKAAVTRDKKQKLMAALEDSENAELKGKSPEDIRAMLDELSDDDDDDLLN